MSLAVLGTWLSSAIACCYLDRGRGARSLPSNSRLPHCKQIEGWSTMGLRQQRASPLPWRSIFPPSGIPVAVPADRGQIRIETLSRAQVERASRVLSPAAPTRIRSASAKPTASPASSDPSAPPEETTALVSVVTSLQPTDALGL